MFDTFPARLTRAGRITSLFVTLTGFGAYAPAAHSKCPTVMGTSEQIVVCSTFPDDIPGKYGAQGASLREAAIFAWQEFIALNWPALSNKRDLPDDTKKFGSIPTLGLANSGPLVWHTFRGKVEIYPGLYGIERDPEPSNPPPGYVNSAALDYGYDAGPAYCYDRPVPGLGSGGAQSACSLDAHPPWINLDENSQILLDQMFAGVVSQNKNQNDDQILFMAKANRKEYTYIAQHGWWNDNAPIGATASYIEANHKLPTDPDKYVSFPPGTVEVKAAWRQLSATEDRSRYYVTKVRYYVRDAKGHPEPVDTEMALVGLHIIHKTPTAPYFVYATFEQADNIVNRDGSPVETEDGAERSPVPELSWTPEIISHNSSSAIVPQTFDPVKFPVRTGYQLYYMNTPYTGIPVKEINGKEVPAIILVNKRRNRIPDDIVTVNKEAHDAIDAYVNDNFGKSSPRSPWKYYKLVNVQSKPITGKIPGVDYNGPDRATYYQANSVIETDYNLQDFSGRFFASFRSHDPYKFTITDFKKPDASRNDKEPFKNVLYHDIVNNQYASVNMGGCMGCHGNVAIGGADFSFILAGGRVHQPEVLGERVTAEQVARFIKYFGPHP